MGFKVGEKVVITGNTLDCYRDRMGVVETIFDETPPDRVVYCVWLRVLSRDERVWFLARQLRHPTLKEHIKEANRPWWIKNDS